LSNNNFYTTCKYFKRESWLKHYRFNLFCHKASMCLNGIISENNKWFSEAKPKQTTCKLLMCVKKISGSSNEIKSVISLANMYMYTR